MSVNKNNNNNNNNVNNNKAQGKAPEGHDTPALDSRIDDIISILQEQSARMAVLEQQLDVTHEIAAKASAASARSNMHEKIADAEEVSQEAFQKAIDEAFGKVEEAEEKKSFMGRVGGFCKKHMAKAAIGAAVVAAAGATAYGVQRYRAGKEDTPLALDNASQDHGSDVVQM